MNVVSLHLPSLRAPQRAGSAPPASVADLYTEVEDLLVYVHGQSVARSTLQQDSSLLKFRLMALVDQIEGALSPATARDLTLAALSGGMFSGALDGILLFAHQHRVAQPQDRSLHPELEKPSRLLWENLHRVLEVAEANWSQAHVDDLQLLSGYGKHENRRSLEEGEAMEQRTRADRTGFQSFLLASFKGGYAMGAVDAAVMFVGGERPGAPPST